MKLIRAILYGALLWVFIFFEVSFLMFGLGLKSSDHIYYNLHYPLMIILTAIVALLYFRNAKAGFGEGLLVGLVMLVSGIILDLIITVPFFTHDYLAFFSNYLLILGYIIDVLIVGIIGAIRKR